MLQMRRMTIRERCEKPRRIECKIYAGYFGVRGLSQGPNNPTATKLKQIIIPLLIEDPFVIPGIFRFDVFSSTHEWTKMHPFSYISKSTSPISREMLFLPRRDPERSETTQAELASAGVEQRLNRNRSLVSPHRKEKPRKPFSIGKLTQTNENLLKAVPLNLLETIGEKV